MTIDAKIYKDDHYLKVIYSQAFDIEELNMENISLIDFTSIVAQVECRKCHLNSEITLEKVNKWQNIREMIILMGISWT